MKILHVISSLSDRFGGPAVALKGLAKNLSCRGHSNTIIATNFIKDDESRYLSDDIRIITLNSLKFAFHNYAYGYNFTSIFLKEIKKADIIHVHGLWQYPTLLAARLCQKLNKPYILRPCGMLLPNNFRRKKLKKIIYLYLLEKKNLIRSSLIQCTSYQELIKMKKHLPHNIKMEMLPLGVDLDFTESETDSIIQAKDALKNKRYILYLGRLHPQKEIELLIRAYHNFCKKRDDIYLFFVGHGHKRYVEKLKRLIRYFNLENKALFIKETKRQDIVKLLSNAELSCILSKEENLSLSIIESLYCKTPVIVSRTIDLAPDIDKIKCGYACGDSLVEISSLMQKVTDSEELKREMGERGRKWVLKNFSWDGLMDRYGQMYDKVLRRHK